MATVGEIYRFLDQKAPFALQAGFDNAGFLVGHEEGAVTRILVALDITPEVIDEAIGQGAQLIISHHPVIWGQISSVTDRDRTGRNLLTLVEHRIAAICAHTNLDAVEGGVNSVLAAVLNLLDPVPLQEDGRMEDGTPYGIGRVGLRAGAPASLPDFAQEVKEMLHVPGIRFLDAGKPVHKVAVGGGACGGLIYQAMAHGCDTFVTAEIKHDIYLEARDFGLNLLDAGHHATEALICPVLAHWLRGAFPALTVEVTRHEGEVFAVL